MRNDGSSNDATRSSSLLAMVVLATVIASTLVLIDLARTSTNPLNLIQPGVQGPSAQVFEEDFPGVALPPSTGLDGQQYYAIARYPLDLDSAAQHLDRPRYRLQRPLLSWLARLGHPAGGGTGLVVSFFVVGVLAIATLAAAVGDISRRLGGPVWTAALVGLFPGVWWSLRVTVADTLATGLALATIALLLRDKTSYAVACACAAVLAKETAALVLLGWLLGNWRDRRAWYPVAVAGVLALSWRAFLSWRLPGQEALGELVVPLSGLLSAIRDRWLVGDELWGLLGATVGISTGVASLWVAGLRHRLSPAIVLQLGFLLIASGDVIGNDFGAGRATLPLLALATITLGTSLRQSDDPSAGIDTRTLTAPSHGATGDDGPGLTSGGSSNA